MTDAMTPERLAGMGIRVRSLEWKEDRRTDMYAEFPIGMNFSGYYTVSDTGAYDLWEVNFGVHCHEFGETMIWKGTGKAAAVKAAEEHNEARILAALSAHEATEADNG